MRAKSKEIKMFQGTLKPSRTDIEGLEFELVERNPSAPEGWPLDAQVIWREVCTWLKQVGHLAKAFTHVIEEYSWAVYRCQVARRKLIDNPDDIFWTKELDTSSKRAERLRVKIGFSPLDARKIEQRNEKKEDPNTLIR